MHFINFINRYKGNEINKKEFIEILENNFKDIKLEDDTYNLVVTLDKRLYQIEYTPVTDNSKNIIILKTSTINQVFSRVDL